MSAYEKVARRLEELILDGTLPPGGKMPSERLLAARLNYSRPLIREALRELRGRGVIETHHGKGSFVAEMVAPTSTQGPLQHLLKDHSRVLYDLLEVRELLEGQAAYYAALRGTDEDRYRITKAFNAMEKPDSQGSDPQVNADLDHRFHRAISEASHNPVLVHTLQSLSELVLNSVLTSVDHLYHRPEEKRKLIQHHRQIYRAVIDQEPEQAKIAASWHIREIRNSFQNIEREEQVHIRAESWSKKLQT